MSCWFRVLCFLGLLNCVSKVDAVELISPGAGTVTTTYRVISSSSSVVIPPIDDYCLSGQDNCDANNGNCTFTGHRTYACSCTKGFTGQGTNNQPCQDVNECQSTPCGPTATCFNEPGSYVCTCKAGYENPPGCSDIDECKSSSLNNCIAKTSSCVNNAGSYICQCHNDSQVYYRKNANGNCIDVDECSESSPCKEAKCTNTDGSYRCGCDDGYLFDSINLRCNDIDECSSASLFTCPLHMKCNNTIGGYSCIPDIGYEYSPPGYSYPVIDINECERTNVCHTLANCTNTEGSYSCLCFSGYSGNGTVCGDINECLDANSCDENANCTNNVGSFTCSCKEGFSGTGQAQGSCLDINECSGNPCSSNAFCENSIGSYSCICKEGYENSPICSDINECLGVNNCHTNASCLNNNGSYTCACKDGFIGSGTDCVDKNECDLQGFCAKNALCANTIGSYKCQCASGFSGNGISCTDVDECSPNPNPCNQTCQNIPGSYLCSCSNGFVLTSQHQCQDINECETSGICPSNSDCINTPGSYTCQCKPGFLDDQEVSEDKTSSVKTCIVDNFVGYDGCPFIQNRDTEDPDRLIQIPEGIPIKGVLQYDFYICINGFISVQFDVCHGHPNGNLGDPLINGTIFAPYFSDIDLHVPNSGSETLANRMYSCKYTAVEPDSVGSTKLNAANLKIQKYVRETTRFKEYVPQNSIIATWYQVVPYLSVTGSDYFNQGERATFQAVITSDGSNTVVYFIYYNMFWSDNKGFPVMVGLRYNRTVSLAPKPPKQYRKYRFDKADFTNDDGNITKGRISFEVSNYVNTQAVKFCQSWLATQPTKQDIDNLYGINGVVKFANQTSNGRQSSCGCTISQLLVDLTFERESSASSTDVEICHSPGRDRDLSACNNLNDDTNVCFIRRNTFVPNSKFKYRIGTRCCYKAKSGSLDTSSSESAFSLNSQNHFVSKGSVKQAIANDIQAHKKCCLETPLCSRYEERTRKPNCQFYTAPSRSVNFGDPHIMTPDGAQYTFNGLGDYWLVTTNDTDIQLDVQARTCQAVNKDGTKTNATVFCGFAFQEKNQPLFEVYFNSTDTVPSYYVDKIKRTFSSEKVNGTEVKFYNSTPSNEVKFILGSGTVMSIQIADRFLQSGLSAPIQIEKKTCGLLGNINGDSFDDFKNRFSGESIAFTSNEEKIYYDFGQSWKVKNDESLFSMQRVSGFGDGYKPLFWTNVSHLMNYNQTLINITRKVCGDETANKECYFDYAVTGNEEIASVGKQFIDESKEVIASVGRIVPKITGPTLINATKGISMNFTITASSNSTNLTYFIITNYTDAFTLLDAKTGLVNFNPMGVNATVIVAAIDEFLNAGVLQVKIIMCDCVHGVCSYEAPELLGNIGKVYNRITQCQCFPGYSGYKCEDLIDVCALDPCFSNVTCYQYGNGSSSCEPCPSGFSGDGRQCYDIDDCNPVNPCEQNCTNSIGAFECTCRKGYEKEGVYNCTDINECINSTVCDNVGNTFCNNTDGSFECLCKTGFRMNSTEQCEDIDECNEKTDGCQHSCQNTIGSYLCQCNSGTNLNADRHTCDDIDECLNSNTCSSNANCYNIYGSFRCECKFGYSGNGFYCQDINECDSNVRTYHGLTTSCEVNCTNLIGSYKCLCGSTQKLSVDQHTCIQKVNPCLEETKYCGSNANCIFDAATYTASCVCKTGFTGNGSSCTDYDECSDANICGKNSTCTNSIGSFQCGCEPGFTRTKDTSCSDINECVSYLAKCDSNTTCHNTIGAYTCTCKDGFIAVQNSCKDLDECAEKNGGCDHVCTNIVGSSRLCSCRAGYKKSQTNPSKCVDIDECATSDPCDNNATCSNSIGGYTCNCKGGFVKVGNLCQDQNECSIQSSNKCTQNCTNTIGSFKCSCRAGYQLGRDSVTCSDIDECLNGQSNCNISLTECRNKPGGYTCRDKCPGQCNQKCNDTETGYKCFCKPGFNLTSFHKCEDIDECTTTKPCHSSEVCLNLEGSYSCSCPSGFEKDAKNVCVDTCELNNGGCHINATCTNRNGTANCQCNSGLSGNGTHCDDVDECLLSNGGCHTNALCTNIFGSHNCKCNSGFDGNGVVCIDRGLCLGKCHVNATCQNQSSSFSCVCKDGFSGNGTDCQDVDNCLMNNGNCHIWANCINTIGSEECVCKEDFEGNGTICYNKIIEQPIVNVSAYVIRLYDASVTLYDVKLDGIIVDIAASQNDIRNSTSPLHIKLKSLLQSVLRTFYSTDKRIISVEIYLLQPVGITKKRSVDPATTPAVAIKYTVGFNVSYNLSREEVKEVITLEANKTDYQVNTRDGFFGRIFPQSLSVAYQDQCTTNTAALKHQCDKNAVCQSDTTYYTCKCKDNYVGDGFECSLIDTGTSFLVAIIATAVGLLVLIVLLVIFLILRKRKRDEMDINSSSSDSDVSWTPGVFGGMRARSMYTPTAVQTKPYSDYLHDD